MYEFQTCYKCSRQFEFADPEMIYVCSLSFADPDAFAKSVDDLFCRTYCRECAAEEKSKRVK